MDRPVRIIICLCLEAAAASAAMMLLMTAAATHPAEYAEQIAWLVSQTGLDRELAALDDATILAAESQLQTEVFEQAGVLRVYVFTIGADWQKALATVDAQGQAAGCVCLQFFLHTAEPSSMTIVPHLRQAGYSLGGIVPRWFDDDALLMQKSLCPTEVKDIKLFSDNARAILAMALADRH